MSKLRMLLVTAVAGLVAAAPTMAQTETHDTARPEPVTSTGNGSRHPALEMRQAPVPLARSTRPPPSAPPSADLPTGSTATQAEPQEGLDRDAAKAAAEADGYKRVSILGKTGNGAWRARGYRGTTEVLLRVGGMGRVSME